MKKQHLQLSTADREYLEGLLSKGNLAVRVYKRALGLLELDRGQSYRATAQTVGRDQNTLRIWCDEYQARGLAFLTDQARPGRPLEIDGLQRAKITALACSDAPEGHARWHLRLLAEKVVELEYCEQISHTTVSQILKKTNYSPT
jgi:putative transposase